ncbi:MAG: response regulator, partial [Algicola sp.]|nr:response regulator [Algicola sp.]
HFLAPKANRYRYRLMGLDEGWTEVDAHRRFARYTNLDPGDYQLRVTASNANGVWADKEALVSFFIATPWWMTYWAYLAYVLLVISVVWVFIRWRMLDLKRKNLALEQQVNARTVDIRQQKNVIEQQVVELKALDKAKEHFFENISHEFRTPLSLIIGPLKRLYNSESNSAITNKLDAPIRQASRLLRLINQFLEISRLQSGVTQLHRRTYRLSEQIRQIVRSFADNIAHKQLHLSLSLDDDLLLDYDASAMEKIVVNLLSNAVNYTDSGGRIVIELTSTPNDVVVLKIQDSGIGIAKEQQADVFERFHKEHENVAFHHGIGIGLALVKELVELHGGRISLESEQGIGSCFTLAFVSVANGGVPEVLDTVDDLSPACLEQSMFRQVKPADVIGNRLIEVGSDTAKWTILIIDDEWDMRVYLSELLQDYHLLLAENGEQGLNIAIEQVPDLIISDVMMPLMDGLALTKALRVQTTTSHIPIILLTAKGGRDSKLAGLREGVDDYIVKPFDEAEFCLRVNNILVIRDELAKSFCDPHTAAAKQLQLPECEQQFINDFREVLQKEYADPVFALVDMANRMHLEKRQLQRKLKALLDTSPSEYLRSFRLNKAAQMLLKGQSVSQTLELSGFMAMSHFSRCFKVRFGVAPSQYRRHVEQSMSS